MLSTKCDYKVKRVNDRLAHLLSKAGMKPTQLTVYTTEKTCKGCSNYHEEGENWWCDTDFEGGWDCYHAEQKIIETVTFYDFRLEGDILTGILTDFESKEIEVVKVVATATGEVLCDFSNEKGDK